MKLGRRENEGNTKKIQKSQTRTNEFGSKKMQQQVKKQIYRSVFFLLYI